MIATDIVVIVIVLLSGLFALMRGFVKEVLGVAGWVGAAFATLYLFKYVTPAFRGFIAIPWLADGAAGLAIFIVSLVVLSAFSHAIAGRVHQSNFSALDKSLGLVFGLLRGVVVVCLAYLALGWAITSPDQYPSWVRQARTTPLVERGARMIEQLIPESARRRGARVLSDAKAKTSETIDAAQAVQKLARPDPKADAKKDPEGYKPDQIKDMDRLIQSKQ